MNGTVIVAILLIYCIARELHYAVTLHKMVNKIMSRNFYDYQISNSVKKEDNKVKGPKELKVPIEGIGELDSLNEL